MLNTTQKRELESVVMKAMTPAVLHPNREVAINALKAVYDDGLYHANKTSFDTHTLLDTVDYLRSIYNHPYVQNRATGNQVMEESLRRGFLGELGARLLNVANLTDPNEFLNKYVVWVDRQNELQYEHKGLLGLSARNDHTNAAEPVTGSDVQRGVVSVLKGEHGIVAIAHISFLKWKLEML